MLQDVTADPGGRRGHDRRRAPDDRRVGGVDRHRAVQGRRRHAGTIGVVGPTRMDYLSAMASVRAVAKRLSEIATEHRAVADGGRPRSLRDPRRPSGRRDDDIKTRLPQARPRTSPRRERRTGGPRIGSRRSRAPTRSSRIPRSVGATTRSATRRTAGRAVHRHPGHLRHVLRRRVQRRRPAEPAPDARRRRRGPRDARHALVHGSGLRRPQGAGIERMVECDRLPGQRRTSRAPRRSPARSCGGTGRSKRPPEHLRHRDDGGAVLDVRADRRRRFRTSVSVRRATAGVRESATVAVDVPAGVSDGMELRVSGSRATPACRRTGGRSVRRDRGRSPRRVRTARPGPLHVLDLSMTQATLGADVEIGDPRRPGAHQHRTRAPSRAR